MRRVLHVMASLGHGGIESYVLNVIRAANRVDFGFGIYVFDPPDAETLAELSALV